MHCEYKNVCLLLTYYWAALFVPKYEHNNEGEQKLRREYLLITASHYPLVTKGDVNVLVSAVHVGDKKEQWLCLWLMICVMPVCEYRFYCEALISFAI